MLQEDVIDANGEVVMELGKLVDEADAHRIAQAEDVEEVLIRSVLNCESDRGVCANCYGRNMATGQLVNIGEAVGVVAAQSIGEPGTQLTLRTFHIGGTADRIAENSQILARRVGTVNFVNVDTVENPDLGIYTVLGRNGEIELLDEQNRVRSRIVVPYGALLKVVDGQGVESDSVLYEWDPYSNVIVSDRSGSVRFVDIIDGVTMREEFEETTGMSIGPSWSSATIR